MVSSRPESDSPFSIAWNAALRLGIGPRPAYHVSSPLVISMSWWYKSQTELLMGVAVISTTLVSGLPPRMISMRAR